MRIPTKHDWQEPDKIIDYSVDLWFTDVLVQVFMGSLSNVFYAEVMAILKCTELSLTKNLMKRKINISSGSRAAIAALAKTITKSSLAWECVQVLGKLGEFNKVTLVWISGHQGIPGKEEADRLAKEGTIEVPPNQYTAIPFSVGKKLIEKHLEVEHHFRSAALFHKA
jgi:hypothetical protein